MCFKMIFICSTLIGISVTAVAQSKSPSDTILTMKGIGPVQLGMTVQESSIASGTSLKKDDSMDGDKYRFFGTKDTYFWVGAKDGRIHMACARSDRVSTSHGIRIGDTTKKFDQFPRSTIKHMKNPLYYQLQSTDQKDKGHIIWFEVSGNKIEGICAGTPTLLAYVMEGGT